jgi:hypothetical protein
LQARTCLHEVFALLKNGFRVAMGILSAERPVHLAEV